MPVDPKTPAPSTTGIRVGASRSPNPSVGRKRDSTMAELGDAANGSTVKKPFPYSAPGSELGHSASFHGLSSLSNFRGGEGSGIGATPRPSSALGASTSMSLATPLTKQTPSSRLSSTLSTSSLQRQLLLLQTTKAELEAKLKEKDGKIERLERDRRTFVDREKEQKDEWERERRELETEKKDLQSTVRTLRSSVTSLQEENTDLSTSQSTLKSSLSALSSHNRTLIDSLNSRISMLEEEKKEAERVADERGQTVDELRTKLELASSPRSESLSTSTSLNKSEGSSDSAILTAELARQQSYLRQLETTNSRMSSELGQLRERHASIEVLREENRGLRARVGTMEEWRERVVWLEREVEQARAAVAQVDDDTAASSGGGGRVAAVELTNELSALRVVHAKLLEEYGSTTALLKQREAELGVMEEREVELRVRVEELEGEREVLEGRVRRGEKEVEVGRREREWLNGIVAKLTKQLEEGQTSVSSTMNAGEAGADTTTSENGIITIQIERIRHLEESNAALQHQNDGLVKEVNVLIGDSGCLGKGKTREELGREVGELKGRVEELEKELTTAQNTITTHLETIDSLEQQLFELGGEIAGGRHVPPGVRVLTMRDNPEERWFEGRREVLERMKGENDGLMRRVGELEARLAAAGQSQGGGAAAVVDVNGNGEGAKGMVPKESWELVRREKEELEEEVKAKEKRLRRLKEIFNSKGAEFRDAIASILGVKLAFFPNGDVRVTSAYDLTTSFVFQPQKKGKGGADSSSSGAIMQLVAQGEGGPANLPETMRYWIEEEQCIPGFMASVTLECYDGWKTQERGQDMVE